MLPVLYNNQKRIVQAEDHVMILTEMNHDARIVRMNAEHDPPEIRKWLGDSIGHWEGDTLVVETTNFRDRPSFARGSRDMTVIERFRMESADKLVYRFTVDDPTVWTAPFTGEYAWSRSDNEVYRVRLSRGELLVRGHHAGCAVARGGVPGRGARRGPEPDPVAGKPPRRRGVRRGRIAGERDVPAAGAP